MEFSKTAKYLRVAFCAAAACMGVMLGSCSEKSPQPIGDTLISFKTEDNWGDIPGSKAEGTTPFTGNNFGVYAYYHGNYNEATGTHLSVVPLMENIEVVKYGSIWDYNPKRYWPNTEDDRLQFYAFYPYDDPRVSYTSLPTGLTATVNVPEADLDVLMANTGKMQKPADGKVGIEFSHILSRVKFSFKYETSTTNSHVTIQRLFFTAPVKGTFSQETGVWSNMTNGNIERMPISVDGVVVTEAEEEVPEFTCYIPSTKLLKDTEFNIVINNHILPYKLTQDIQLSPAASTTLSFVIKETSDEDLLIFTFALWHYGGDNDFYLN